MNTQTLSIWGSNQRRRAATTGGLSSSCRCCPIRAVGFSQLILLAIAAYFCSSLALWAQTSNSQGADTSQSAPATNWTATTESHDGNTNEDPIRTVESHSQSGNRTVDEQSVERRGSDGSFEPYQDIEKETVQVDSTTVRITTRTFNRNADGDKTLVEVTEEETRTSAGGDLNVARTTSAPDANGNLQLVRRQLEETKKTSPNVEESKTTVLLPDINGGLTPAVKVQERREQDANGSGTVESQKTTLLPDGAGNWQVGEIRETTSKQEGADHRTDERVSRPDSEGRLGEISHTISQESESSPGEARKTVETYSVDVPGAVADGSLHLVQRATTAQATISTGQQVTEQKVEQANPGDPGSGLQVTTVTVDTVRPAASGAQATRTVQARDTNGNLDVISVDTTKSSNIHAIQIQIAPPEKPKAQ
jgi:hypothetical protein